jgi:hypothetical protein
MTNNRKYTRREIQDEIIGWIGVVLISGLFILAVGALFTR